MCRVKCVLQRGVGWGGVRGGEGGGGGGGGAVVRPSLLLLFSPHLVPPH